MPLRYITAPWRAGPAGPLRAARVALVTPLRDGMNLVAKEFVAAQDPGDPGVLVLSRFAGAAEQLTEALIVNPFDGDGVAEAMHEDLAMPLDERQAPPRARCSPASASRTCTGGTGTSSMNSPHAIA